MSPFDGDLLADDEMLEALQSKENEFLFSHLEEEPGEEDIQRTVSNPFSFSDALSCCYYQKTKACICILDSASRLGCIV